MLTPRGLGFPSRFFPTYTGVWALVWKDCVQSWREFDLKSFLAWLVMFASALGMMIAPDWGTRIWVFVIWGVVIGQVCSRRFRSDLRLWAIFQLLPFSGKRAILAEMASSAVGAVLVSWLAYGICRLFDLHPSIPVVLLAPGIIVCFTLAAIFDIIRQIKTDALLAGHGFEMGVVGLLLGLFLAGVPLAIVLWSIDHLGGHTIVGVASLSGLFLCLTVAYGMWQLSASRLKKIK